MARKPTTASVGEGNLALAKKGLEKRQKAGFISATDTVLSIADHGEVIVVYTESASFGMVKEKEEKNASISETG